MALVTDPIDLLLGADGDLDITGGKLSWSRGIPAVVQGIFIRLRTVRGEAFRDLEHGVPYLANDVVDASEAILGQRFDEAKARATFRTEILKAPGAEELLGLAVAFDGSERALTVSFQVRTAFGDSALETVVI